MQFCYVDESGDATRITAVTDDVQPVHVVLGIIVGSDELSEMTHSFLALKRDAYSHLSTTQQHDLDWTKIEMKGSDIRKDWLSNIQVEHDRAFAVISETLSILEAARAKIVGRILVKGVGVEVNETSVYTTSVQHICDWFNKCLCGRNARGIVIADTRNQSKNVNLSHSIFTQKFKRSGDEYSRILEMPVFGHSENHAGIQIVDVMCSALISPMVAYTYCRGTLKSRFVDEGFEGLKRYFRKRLRKLVFEERDAPGEYPKSGLVVSDALTQRHVGYLFDQD